MQILHVIPTLDPRAGGPTAVVNGLAPAQADAGLKVSVLTTWSEGEVADAGNDLTARGVGVVRVGPATGALRRHPDLPRIVEENVAQADVVHIHALWEEIQHLAALAAHRAGKPYVITPHGMLDPWSLAQKKWKKRLYMAWRLRRHLQRASLIHYTTAMERNACAILGLKPPAIVEPIGINLEEFQDLPDRQAIRQKFPQIADRPIIAFLGRIHPGKGLEHLVPAVALLRDLSPVLIVAGPDSQDFQRTIEAMVANHGLQPRVIFTGMLKGRDRIEMLAGADLFCMPSDHENFGVAVIEALAAGTPVVISKEVGVWQEVAGAGVGAATSRDPHALATELTRWLKDDRLRHEAAARCRRFVWDRYDFAKIAHRWEQMYIGLCASRR